MKTTFQNRSRLNVEFKLLEPKKWRFRIDDPRELPWSFSGTGKNLFSIDPPGGPYLAVGEDLNDYSRQLPKELITRIAFEPYAVDPSGYEYYDYIIYTA